MRRVTLTGLADAALALAMPPFEDLQRDVQCLMQGCDGLARLGKAGGGIEGGRQHDEDAFGAFEAGGQGVGGVDVGNG